MTYLKIYHWEGQTYPKFHESQNIGRHDAHIYFKKFARHFKVSEPRINYTIVKRNGGTYFHGSETIALEHLNSLGTIVHEFAHHLADQTNGKRNSHNKHFKKSLKKVYTFAKARNYLNK